MILMCWIALGALFNSLLMHLSFIDGLYYSVVTIETIGFGDIVPKSVGARVFTGFYSVVGILNLAVAVSTTRDTIVESFEHSYKASLHSLKEMQRKHRQHKALRKAQKAALKNILEMAEVPVYVKKRHARGMRVTLNIEALTQDQRERAMKDAEANVQRHETDLTMHRTRTGSSSFSSETVRRTLTLMPSMLMGYQRHTSRTWRAK